VWCQVRCSREEPPCPRLVCGFCPSLCTGRGSLRWDVAQPAARRGGTLGAGARRCHQVPPHTRTSPNPPTCTRCPSALARVPAHVPVQDKPHWCSRAHLGAGGDADVTGNCQLPKVRRVTCGDRKKTLLRERDERGREKAARRGCCCGSCAGTPAPGRCGTGSSPTGTGLQWWHWGRAAAPLSPCAALGPSPGPRRGPSPGALRLAAGTGLQRGRGCSREHPAPGVLQQWGDRGQGEMGTAARAGGCRGPHVPATRGRTEIASAAERAAFPLNGKSGCNLGPFQSPPSRAPAAIRRQGRRGAGAGGLLPRSRLCPRACPPVPHPRTRAQPGPPAPPGTGHPLRQRPGTTPRPLFNGFAATPGRRRDAAGLGGSRRGSRRRGGPQWTRTSILWLPRFRQTGPSLPALADSTTVTATSPFGKRVENLGGRGRGVGWGHAQPRPTSCPMSCLHYTRLPGAACQSQSGPSS